MTARAGARGPDWSEARDLEMLHLREACGLTCEAVALRLGVTKNAVIGRLRRINQDMAEGAAGDGTMPPGWWRAGLAKRGGGR